MEEKIQAILSDHREKEGNIITLLQKTQEIFGYIPEEAVFRLSKELDIPASNFFGVATFYAQFYLKPRGKNIITACCGTACHVKGSERLITHLKETLNLTDEKNTTDDMKFTLEEVACFGACSIAPVVVFNHNVHGKMTIDKVNREVRTLNGGRHE